MAKPKLAVMDFLQGVHASGRQTQMLEIDKVFPDPNNPRTTFRDLFGEIPESVLVAMQDLADSIAEEGLISPIEVREHPDKGPGYYMLVAGERRWRAHGLNRQLGREGFGIIESFVTTAEEERVARRQMSENIQREDLTDLQIATAMRRFLERFPYYQQKDLMEVFHKKGKNGNVQWVSRMMGLLDPKYAELIDQGYIQYASILEHYKTLDEKGRAQVLAEAKAAQTPIRKPAIDRVKNAGRAAASAPAGATGTEGQHSVPHAPAAAPAARASASTTAVHAVAATHLVRLPLSRLATLKSLLPPDADPPVSVQLDVKEIKRVIERLDGTPEALEFMLGEQLSELLANHPGHDG